jgi:hypothetical protein
MRPSIDTNRNFFVWLLSFRLPVEGFAAFGQLVQEPYQFLRSLGHGYARQLAAVQSTSCRLVYTAFQATR